MITISVRMRRVGLKLAVLGGVAVLVVFGFWVLWTETNPESERELRIAAQDQLQEWFPEQMALSPEWFGFHAPGESENAAPDVILIHGLDEPGGIWDESFRALDEAGLVAWEFRYPNDQAIDRSADLLAEHWSALDADQPVILVGHSMGGLVIRDFVTRWRHPVDGVAEVDGPEVLGVIMIATPNQGSAWARLRAWLQVREWIAQIPEGEISPFAGLRQGTGAAKIDLRPDSRFLTDLNERTWPEQVRLFIIGGQLSEPTPDMLRGLDRMGDELAVVDLRDRVESWWAETGEGLGDGVVPVSSLHFEGAPDPLLVSASHRGLLVDLPLADGEPPAIEPMVETIGEWRGTGNP